MLRAAILDPSPRHAPAPALILDHSICCTLTPAPASTIAIIASGTRVAIVASQIGPTTIRAELATTKIGPTIIRAELATTKTGSTTIRAELATTKTGSTTIRAELATTKIGSTTIRAELAVIETSMVCNHESVAMIETSVSAPVFYSSAIDFRPFCSALFNQNDLFAAHTLGGNLST